MHVSLRPLHDERPSPRAGGPFLVQAKYEKYLTSGDDKLLHNSMAFDLGLSNTPKSEEVDQLIRELNTNVSDSRRPWRAAGSTAAGGTGACVLSFARAL